jgi:hypothetical protein
VAPVALKLNVAVATSIATIWKTNLILLRTTFQIDAERVGIRLPRLRFRARRRYPLKPV